MRRRRKLAAVLPKIDRLTGQDREQRLAHVKSFYQSIRDPDQRLVIASFEGDADFAIEAIERGANVNAFDDETGMRVIHLAASGGYRKIVDALMQSGACDLTVRDQQGRLPSDCAAYGARDFELADRLAEAEARQFAETGKDPRIRAIPNEQ